MIYGRSVTKKTCSIIATELERTLIYVMQPSLYTVQRNCIHEQCDGQNSISEHKLTLLNEKGKYKLLIHWKTASFNVIIFQFYSQSFSQHFLSTSKVSCYNNTLLTSCHERSSLQAHFLITMTSCNTGSRSRNIHGNLNYGEHISCSKYVKYGREYILQLPLLNSISIFQPWAQVMNGAS